MYNDVVIIMIRTTQAMPTTTRSRYALRARSAVAAGLSENYSNDNSPKDQSSANKNSLTAKFTEFG